MEILENELLEFIEHLHSRGDSLGNWNKLHNLLYYTPNPAMFRHGGKVDLSDMDKRIDLCMQYYELYSRLTQ